MPMTPALRKFALTTHVTSSIGWIGAVIVFLALAVLGLTSQDPQMVRGVYLVMEHAAWLTLVPLAFASLVTGFVMSLGTSWGLFRHYWVVFKLLITAFATVVLLIYMQTFRQMAALAAPRWVKVFGIIAIVVFIAFVIAPRRRWSWSPHGAIAWSGATVRRGARRWVRAMVASRADSLFDLTSDLATRPPRRMNVDVGEAGANGFDELRKSRRLTGVDALGRRTDHIGCRDHACDSPRWRRTRGLSAPAAQKRRDATVDAARADVDVRGEHRAIGDERRGADSLEILVTELVLDHPSVVVNSQIERPRAGCRDRRILLPAVEAGFRIVRATALGAHVRNKQDAHHGDECCRNDRLPHNCLLCRVSWEVRAYRLARPRSTQRNATLDPLVSGLRRSCLPALGTPFLSRTKSM